MPSFEGESLDLWAKTRGTSIVAGKTHGAMPNFNGINHSIFLSGKMLSDDMTDPKTEWGEGTHFFTIHTTGTFTHNLLLNKTTRFMKLDL